MAERKNFSVIPAGEWGAAFGGFVVAPLGHNVVLYVPDPEEARLFRRIHRIERLPDAVMPPNVKATADLREAIEHADVLVWASKAQSLRRRYRESAPYIQARRNKQPIRLILSKGIEEDSNLRMSEVILQEDPGCNDHIACLSGPTLAKEIAKGAVAGAAVGADNPKTADRIQSLINSRHFKIYTQFDLTGVELGGALKNVYALGAGMLYAVDPPRSTKALYVTRALEEWGSLGVRMGAHESTLSSLSILGDFILAVDDHKGGATRNFRAGVRLAQGQSVEEVKQIERTVEGLDTLKSAKELSQGKAPIILGIDGVANRGLKINDGINQLLGQQPLREQNGHKGLRFSLAVQLRRWRHNLGGFLHK